MTLAEVTPFLLAEGCNPMTFAVGSRGSASDAYVLAQQNGRWEVFYTERGSDSAPIFSTDNEDEACRFFIQKVSTTQQWHMVGWFTKEADANQMEEKIKTLGITPIRNDIPCFSGPRDPRYRLFVVGKDIFPMRTAFATLPVKIES